MSETKETKKSAEMFFCENFKCNNKGTVVTLTRPKEGCDKIVLNWNEQARIEKLIYELFSEGRPFGFRISEKLGDGCCKVDEVEVPFNGCKGGKQGDARFMEKVRSEYPDLYHVLEMQSEETKTIFILDRAKEGFEKIEFRYNDRAELKGLLMNLFQGAKPFDFKIAKKGKDGCCEINAVTIPYM
ncbi:MAG: hypothetical protein GY950_28995 [bacterium]|nr:hypothetical protein [bacterium]